MSTPNWHKSTYSGGNTNDCVECATNTPVVMIRDTKDRDAGTVAVSRGAWRVFAVYVGS
ncbi:DUF397 domain-containing protein [Streptomyces sp. NPDC001941]|uniref:DUF397 domain-containing protein n=1 Tax=Streptomyces sp. NPDC001941 TaxID=3154659 RepID=UPI00332EE383